LYFIFPAFVVGYFILFLQYQRRLAGMNNVSEMTYYGVGLQLRRMGNRPKTSTNRLPKVWTLQ